MSAVGDTGHTVQITAEIEPALGVVVVDAWGALLEVRLDRSALPAVPPETVGPRILRAIRAAEARAARYVAARTRGGSR